MTTMLDKVAVAGDITQALDRRGVWTCAITVIGGTSSTAVKVQTCDTAGGSYEDFKTLIPASEASTNQYKGFVVDLHGAKKFIKVVGATMATAVFGDCDHDIKDVAIKAGEIPSGADLDDNKTATIDVSTYTEPVVINPTEGKDGMKKATVTLSNIPSGSEVAYCWRSPKGTQPETYIYLYTTFSIAQQNPTNEKSMSWFGNTAGYITVGDFDTEYYTKISDTSFDIDGTTWERYTDGDITVW